MVSARNALTIRDRTNTFRAVVQRCVPDSVPSTINMRKHANTISCMCCGTVKKTGEEIVLTGSFDGRVGVWDVRSKLNERPHLMSLFPQGAAQPGTVGGGTTTCGATGTSVVDVGSSFERTLPEILAVHYDANNHAIITGGNDVDIKVYDANTYELIGKHVGHTEPVTCFASDENFLFSGSEDASIKVWDLLSVFVDASGQLLQPDAAQTSPTPPASRSRSGTGASGSLPVNGIISRTPISSTALSTLRRHERSVIAIAAAGRGDVGFLVSASHDGCLYVWDYTSGQVLYGLRHHEEFKSMVYRRLQNDVVIGTDECNLLRIPLHKVDETMSQRREWNEGDANGFMLETIHDDGVDLGEAGTHGSGAESDGGEDCSD